MTRKHRRPLVALLIALAVAATATVGSAATLTVNAASISLPSYSGRCSTDVVQAGNVSAASITLTVPAGCNGLSGKLRLVGASGALAPSDTAFTLPASGTLTTIAVPAYTEAAVTSVALVVDGWGMPTSWTYLPPASSVIVAGNGDTLLTIGAWYLQGGLTCVDVGVKVRSGNKVWAISVDSSAQPFAGSAPILGGPDAAKAILRGTPGGLMTISGAPGWEKVHHSDPALLFQICG